MIFFDNPQNLRREAGKNLPIVLFYTCVILFFIDKIKDETNVSIVNTRFEKALSVGHDRSLSLVNGW